MTMFCIGQCAIKPLKSNPFNSLESVLILFTVCLGEDILDPVDPVSSYGR